MGGLLLPLMKTTLIHHNVHVIKGLNHVMYRNEHDFLTNDYHSFELESELAGQFRQSSLKLQSNYEI